MYLRRSQRRGRRDSHLHGGGRDGGRLLPGGEAAGAHGGQGHPLRGCGDGRRREDLQQHAAGRHHDRHIGSDEPRHQVKAPAQKLLFIETVLFKAELLKTEWQVSVGLEL